MRLSGAHDQQPIGICQEGKGMPHFFVSKIYTAKKYSADFSSNFDDHRNFLMSLLRQQELRKKCNFFPLLLLGRVEARSNGSFWEIAGQVA